MPTIYRQYRPQKFSDFFGQNHLVETLTNEIKNNRVAHAYIFSGPRGTGKTTLARLLAKAVNCPHRATGEYEPCDQCASCQEISASRNMDVMEMDAASHTGVENVRENIIDNAQFKPGKSPYKIFIIDEVHMLSTSSFNALLKILEEPPKYVIFILATTEWHKIPATIISRCERFIFKKISRELIKKKLKNIAKTENVKIDEEVWEKIISRADGCLRDAESLLGQILSLGRDHLTLADTELILPGGNYALALNFITALTEKNNAGALAVINETAEQGVNPEEFIQEIIELWRAVMMAQADNEHLNNLDFNDETKKCLRDIAGKITTSETIRFLENAIKRKAEIKLAPLPRLPLEILAMETADDMPPIINDEHTPPAPPPLPPTPSRSSDSTPPPPDDTHPTDEPRYEPIKSEDAGDREKTLPETKYPAVELAEVEKNWDNFIKEIDERCPSLIFLLNMARRQSVVNNCLRLTVGYSFHKEKLEQPISRQVVEECLSKAVGKKITIEYEVDETEADKQDKIDDVTIQFGSETI